MTLEVDVVSLRNATCPEGAAGPKERLGRTVGLVLMGGLADGLTKNWSTRLESLIKTIVENGINAIGSGGRAATNRALKPNIGIPYAERSDVTRESSVAATTWKRVVAAATAHPSGSTPSRALSTGSPITKYSSTLKVSFEM